MVFFSREIWSKTDVSSVSPPSEQTAAQSLLIPNHNVRRLRTQHFLQVGDPCETF